LRPPRREQQAARSGNPQHSEWETETGGEREIADLAMARVAERELARKKAAENARQWQVAIGLAASALLLLWVPALTILAWLYFAPLVVALYRRHHQTLAIFALTLFPGWTVVGWIAALVWACTDVRRK
jgi:Superinfection immunity protein